MAYTQPSTRVTGFLPGETEWNVMVNNWRTLFTAAGLLTHEFGGLELDISAITKGGLFSASAAGVVALRDIGGDGSFLQADSAQSTGMKWQAAPQHTMVTKTSDEIVNNSDALQDDNDLTISVTTNKNYAVWGVLLIDTGATPEMKISWSLPASGRADTVVTDMQVNQPEPWTEAANAIIGGAGAATPQAHPFVGVLTIEGTGGTAVIQWAQNVADGSDTKMLEGSWLAHQLLN